LFVCLLLKMQQQQQQQAIEIELAKPRGPCWCCSVVRLAVLVGLLQIAGSLLQVVFIYWKDDSVDPSPLLAYVDYLDEQEFTWRRLNSEQTLAQGAASAVSSALLHVMIVACMLVGICGGRPWLLLPEMSLLGLKVILCLVLAATRMLNPELDGRERRASFSSLFAAAFVNACFFGLLLACFGELKRRRRRRRSAVEHHQHHYNQQQLTDESSHSVATPRQQPHPADPPPPYSSQNVADEPPPPYHELSIFKTTTVNYE
ncbi:hypothetical protein T10_10467, partial [Trichinella papuae]